MTVAVPARLLREQLPNITAFLRGAVTSYLPVKSARPGDWLQRELPAPSDALIDTYARWSGAPAGRYADEIPPHLASGKLALGLIAELTSQSPYPMLSVLNQGVRLQVNAPLPRGQRLNLRGQLVDASDDGYRARVHSRIVLGTSRQPDALVIDAMAAVVLRNRPASLAEPREEPVFTPVGYWQAGPDEGVKFFYLTGDFNPIHTLPLVARRTRFKGCIMHGYGAFAQVFEAVQNTGGRIADIEVRFIRPLPLPSPQLVIEVAEPGSDGRRPLRLRDGEGTVYQVGSFLPQEVA